MVVFNIGHLEIEFSDLSKLNFIPKTFQSTS